VTSPMPSKFENGEFRELTEDELYPEPNVWSCPDCGEVFSPAEHLPETTKCPECGRLLRR